MVYSIKIRNVNHNANRQLPTMDNRITDEPECCQDSAFEICSRYSTILSKFDVSGSFSDEAWLYKPADKEPKKQGSSPSELHAKLASYLNEPDVENLKRSLLLHLGEQLKKESQQSDPLQQQKCDKSAEDTTMDPQNEMHDITDIEIAAKMQEEYLQRSVLQLAKRLAADDSTVSTPQQTENLTAAYKKTPKPSKYSKPGRTYGIRSNTQTLRVSPTNMTQSTPIHPPVKYTGRSITQTLRVSPIAPCSNRTLSVPRCISQNGRSKSKESVPQRSCAPSPQIRPKQCKEDAASETRNERISRINAANAYIRTKSNKDSSIRSLSSGAPQLQQKFTESKSRLPSTSRLTVARNMPTNFSTSRKQQTAARNTANNEKTKPQGANIVRYVVGGGATQNGNNRQAKPSFLPRPRATNLPKRQLNLEQYTNI